MSDSDTAPAAVTQASRKEVCRALNDLSLVLNKSVIQLEATLAAVQLAEHAAQENVRKLQHENATLELASASSKTKSSKVKQPLVESAIFSRIARRWCTMHQPWINEGDLFGKERPIGVRPNDGSQRYISNESDVLASVEELYSVTDSKYHEMIQKGYVGFTAPVSDRFFNVMCSY
jgi:hypothetical protein